MRYSPSRTVRIAVPSPTRVGGAGRLRRMRRGIVLVAVLVVALGAVPAAGAAPSLLTDSVGPLASPYGIAVSPDGSSVRVMEPGADDTVAYVDAATNAISGADVTVGNNAYFGAFDGTGGIFYTANNGTGANSVSVIVDRSVVATLTVGSRPYLIQSTAGGTKIVTMNQGDGGSAVPSVSLIDTATPSVDRTIAVGSAGQTLNFMAVHPAGTTAWASSQSGAFVKAVNLATGAVTTITPPLSGGQVPRDVFASADGSVLAVTLRTVNGVALLNAATGAVLHSIALTTVRPQAVRFSPDNAIAYVLTTLEASPSANPQVRAYSVATGALLQTFSLRDAHDLPGSGDPAEWFAITPDGSNLFVPTIRGAATPSSFMIAINAIDTRTGRLTVVDLPAFGNDFGYMTLNPQGNRLYVTNGDSSGLLAVLSTAATPGAPTAVAATAGDGSARITWTAPADDGGAAITRYTATASPGGKSCTWTSGELACTISELTNGTAYSVTVTATTLAGTSAASSAATVTPGRTPGAPTAARATAGLLRATVTWKAPTDTGGGITGYTATASPGGASCTTTGALTCTITGLLNTKAYTVTVAARSAGGTGAASAKSAAVRPYRKLGMRAPKAAGTTIRSQVKVAGPGTITQTGTLKGTVCRASAKPKKKGTATLKCAINKAGRTALKRKAQTITVLTTLLTKQGASFAATHRVKLPKTG